jgi:hypothetical protein
MAERDRRTGAKASNEGFLQRWSRRKAQARSAPVETPAAAVEDSVPAAEITPASSQQGTHGQDAPAPVDPKDLPDIESLAADSDFSVFMRPGVPAHLRTQALRKLWRSDPIFSQLDGLVEYGEDYTLPSWPKGTIKTAYQIGRGFVNELEKLAEPEAGPAPPLPPEAPTPEAAPSIGPTTPEEPVALAQSRQPAPEAARSDHDRPAAPAAPGPARAKAGTRCRPRPLPRRG